MPTPLDSVLEYFYGTNEVMIRMMNDQVVGVK